VDVIKELYLVGMGATTGLVTAAACGHLVLWLGVGVALGAVWSGADRRVPGRCSGSVRRIFSENIKVFCFFSSEKKAFLLGITTHPRAAASSPSLWHSSRMSM
jgi:hypothetical protein